VTALDFAPSAIAKARRKARAAGVEVDFLVDDLTDLRKVRGTFELLVDYGTLDDLALDARDAYVRQVVPLLRPGGRFLLWCFEWDYRPWERLLLAVLPFGQMAMAPGEADRRFAGSFEIDRFAGEQDLKGWPRGWAAYLMTKRPEVDARATQDARSQVEEEAS
jgi:SAM-dependent methyltransferase